MKLATFTAKSSTGRSAIGLVDRAGERILDLQTRHVRLHGRSNPAFEDMLSLIDAGPAGLDAVRELESASRGAEGWAPLAGVRLLAPVPEPRQIREFSVFEQHFRDAPIMSARTRARRDGQPLPEKTGKRAAEVFYRQPAYYIMNRFNVIGHEADIEWPSYSGYLDYELEIGMFLAKGGKNIRREQAHEHIFGYTIFNDVSAREQMWREMETRMGPTKGKSFDTGNVVGPWIVTADDIGDVKALRATVRVNGEVWASNTGADMVHSFEDMIAYVSRDETLHAGELFCSGTVGGCSGMEIERWVELGDVVEFEVEKIGVLRNKIVPAPTRKSG
jgi:2-keto-4-pentenoate hydratase/2-oxohepta-3-ene-1,7-dioic acid hydratase in catechol pathway